MKNYDEEARMGQSEMGCKTQGKTSLVHVIDNNTKEIIEILRGIEGLTENINQRLLSSVDILDGSDAAEPKLSAPSGWLEEHLADLKNVVLKINRIGAKLEKLSWATKTDVK